MTSTRPPAARQPIMLHVEGMTCGSCVSRLEKALRAVPGVSSAHVNLTTCVATIEPGETPPAQSELLEAVRAAGYDAEAIRSRGLNMTPLEQTHLARLREQSQALWQSAALGLPVMAIHWLAPLLQGGESYGYVWPHAIQAVLCTLLIVSPAGAPILVAGMRAAIHRSPNMDLLISTGVSTALVSGIVNLFRGNADAAYFHAVAMILGFINLGRFIELRARRHASTAIATLARRLPRTAQVVTEEGVTEVNVEQIAIGDHVRVAQDTIAGVDGLVIEGEAAMDESAVTGEPLPRHRGVGDLVVAGSVCREGLITIEATRVGSESTMGRIIRAVEEAQAGKTEMQRIADKVAGVFVPVVIGLAAVTLAGTLLL
ncbi:MAG: heavy metal translocating P-type ATPase, partial [Phycisphaerae bacterium]